jgi:hypothetical protein
MVQATELMKWIKTYPLHPTADWTEPTWTDLTKIDGADFTPVRWEDNLDYWQVLHEILDAEPPNPAYRFQYGELAQLGSVTVYDARTRSEIATGQDKAALRSMFELANVDTAQPVTLYFSPAAPAGDAADRWIQTIPGQGWFVYFRIYGPDAPAFDGTWQLPDFTRAGGQ